MLSTKSQLPVLFFSAVTMCGAGELQIDFENHLPLWRVSSGDNGGGGSSELRARSGVDESVGLVWKYDLGEKPGAGVYSRIAINLELPTDSVMMSFMMYGDNSLAKFGLRLRDATGRVWQQSLPEINWTGWREIKIELKPVGYAWGGTAREDGGFTYPITLAEMMIDHAVDHPLNRVRGEVRLDRFVFSEIDVAEF